MTKVQTIIKEIKNLSIKDLEAILQEILHRMNRQQRIEAAMNDFIGSGRGVWETDAQDHVNSLREEDRF